MRAKLRGLVDKFQSTHPARGATLPRASPSTEIARISIHAPREGCDPCNPAL